MKAVYIITYIGFISKGVESNLSLKRKVSIIGNRARPAPHGAGIPKKNLSSLLLSEMPTLKRASLSA